jgi:Flp pilus assembly protein TadG
MKKHSTEMIKAEQGNVLVMVAVALVVLLLMTALVIDVGNLFYRRAHLQNAADAAALAAATEGKIADDEPDKDPDEEEMKDAAIEYIELHGLAEGNLSSFAYVTETKTVVLTLSAEEPLFFGPLVKIDHWSFTVQAGAKWFDFADTDSFSGVRLVGVD